MKRAIAAAAMISLMPLAAYAGEPYLYKLRRIGQMAIDSPDSRFPLWSDRSATYNILEVESDGRYISVEVQNHGPGGSPADILANEDDTIELVISDDGRYVGHFIDKGMDMELDGGVVIPWKGEENFRQGYRDTIDQVYRELFQSK
jgi:hypothetical protein